MNFAEHLMSLRRQRGWSQEELGNQVGVTRQTVSKWEMGQSTPELEKLVELAMKTRRWCWRRIRSGSGERKGVPSAP